MPSPRASKPAGHSGTPLPKKLGLKPGCTFLVANGPDGFARALGELPEGVRVATRGKGPFDVTAWFCLDRAELAKGLRARIASMGDGMMWICWPKRASGVATDLTEGAVREAGLAEGIVDSKVAAIDATWSGLRFTRRRTPAG